MQEEIDRQRELTTLLHKRLEKVTPALFAEFLYKRGVPDVRCLLCGSESIGIPETSLLSVGPEGTGNTSYLNFVKVETYGPPYSLMDYQYRLICKNCGYTSHIAVWPVLKWIEEDNGQGA